MRAFPVLLAALAVCCFGAEFKDPNDVLDLSAPGPLPLLSSCFGDHMVRFPRLSYARASFVLVSPPPLLKCITRNLYVTTHEERRVLVSYCLV